MIGVLALHGRHAKDDVPKPLKHHPGVHVGQIGVQEPLAELNVLALRPAPHGFFRHGELRAADRGDVFGHGDAEPGVPVFVDGRVDGGVGAGGESFVLLLLLLHHHRHRTVARLLIALRLGE